MVNKQIQQHGRYDPGFEHHSCGVGIVAHIKGDRPQQILVDALEMPTSMELRGACGCEPNTGDGSGMLTAVPQMGILALHISKHCEAFVIESEGVVECITNGFSPWSRAQPKRIVSRNGEINPFQGNSNWVFTRRCLMQSDLFVTDIEEPFSVIEPHCSDADRFNTAMEMLYHAGRSLPGDVMMMMISEAWQNHASKSGDRRACCEFDRSIREPWDGPASTSFTDGHFRGTRLDRNGLCPCRDPLLHDIQLHMDCGRRVFSSSAHPPSPTHTNFNQLVAQVTNPVIDTIHENMFMLLQRDTHPKGSTLPSGRAYRAPPWRNRHASERNQSSLVYLRRRHVTFH